MSTSSSKRFELSEDMVDDLLYFSRIGDSSTFQSLLSSLSATYSCAPMDILASTIDSFTGNTILHMSAANGHSEFILSFLPHLVPLANLPNSSGNTPLHWSSLNGNLEVVKILISKLHADPKALNNAGHDAVYEAEVNGKDEVVRWLLENCEGLLDVVVSDSKDAAERKENESEDIGEQGNCDHASEQMKNGEVEIEKGGLIPTTGSHRANGGKGMEREKETNGLEADIKNLNI